MVSRINSFSSNYIMNTKDGIGKYTWPDGKVYDGEWKNGVQHGKGKIIKPGYTPRVGIWEEGKHIKWLDEENNSGNRSLAAGGKLSGYDKSQGITSKESERVIERDEENIKE